MPRDDDTFTSISIRLTRAQKRKLKEQADLLEMSVSELVRRVFFGENWHDLALEGEEGEWSCE